MILSPRNDGSFAGTVTLLASIQAGPSRAMTSATFGNMPEFDSLRCAWGLEWKQEIAEMLRFQVTPSNIFVVYPSIITETTGLGFTFQRLG